MVERGDVTEITFSPKTGNPKNQSTALNITSPKALKNAGGTLLAVSVIVPGDGPATLHDCAAPGAASIENQVASIPGAVGTYQINFPCLVGIAVVPGPGQTLAVSFQ
jgi:hypothetical protein